MNQNSNYTKDYKYLFDVLPEKIKDELESALTKKMNINLSQLEEEFNKVKKDKINKTQIYVGAGTCGLGAGARETINSIKDYLKEKSIEAEIIEVGCIGLCSSEPIVDIQLPSKNRISFQNVYAEKVNGIFDKVFNNEIPSENVLGQFNNSNLKKWENVPYLDEHSFFAPQMRFVLKNCGVIDPENILDYIACGGYGSFLNVINHYTPEELCNTIKESGLRGRGGGGFLTGLKWKLALDMDSHDKYMICNADEGDPGAFMDRAVIEGDPHKLIEGLAIASYAIQASKAYVYIRAEYPLAILRLQKAIKEATKMGFLGNNIYDSSFNLEIIIKKGAGAFVCGEETALIHSIEGKRGMPRPRPPYPSTSGLFEKPSAINNVETLANVPTIISNGADWFSSIGTEKSKGTKVFALSGKINRTGLIEVAMGTTIREIVYDIGEGIPNGKKYKAVQIGGPSGGCIPEQHIDKEIDYDSLKEIGAMMGSGGLVVMDEDNCMVDMAKFFMDFIQRESCGKCIPCREGTLRMMEILKTITRSRKNESGNQALDRFNGIIQLENLAKVIKETSLCGLGQSAPNPVLSTLRWFKKEYEEHIYDRKCQAGACHELLTYTIDEEKCIGCGACKKKCPAEAIMGNKKTPHYIIPDKCIACGACLSTCKFDAVKVS